MADNTANSPPKSTEGFNSWDINARPSSRVCAPDDLALKLHLLAFGTGPTLQDSLVRTLESSYQSPSFGSSSTCYGQKSMDFPAFHSSSFGSSSELKLEELITPEVTTGNDGHTSASTIESTIPEPLIVPNANLKLEEFSDDYHLNKTEALEEQDDSCIETVTTGDDYYTSAATFEDLKLSPELLKGLYAEMGFKRPSKIQAVSLPMILSHPFKNLVAQAHNGSGKTTCFVLGMLSRVNVNEKTTQALCICPTRELALQNLAVLEKMSKYTGITSSCAIPTDVPTLKRPPITEQVVIGTPGTVKGLFRSGKLVLSAVNILVFDEADRMLDEDGFKDDSLRIMKGIGTNCQVLLFSATFNDNVKNFVLRAVKDANQLFVKKEELTLNAVKQYNVYCPDQDAKINVIKDKIFELGQKWGQTIVFVRTRSSAEKLQVKLQEYGYDCTCIHGILAQGMRDDMVREFKEGRSKVLITTDLLSRGFDQSQVNLVVNFDLPVKYNSPMDPDYEVYLHRVGRAGRFGRKGAVFNLLSTNADYGIMDKIEMHFNHQVSVVPNWQSDEAFETALKEAGLL